MNWGALMAWCWTLPVNMIEVNVSVNCFLNIWHYLWKCHCWVMCVIGISCLAQMALWQIVAPAARGFREARNISLLRTGKAGMKPCQTLILLNCLWVQYIRLTDPPDLRDRQTGRPPRHTHARRSKAGSHPPCTKGCSRGFILSRNLCPYFGQFGEFQPSESGDTAAIMSHL